MATLTDYLDAANLKQLQEMFSAATGSQLRICSADGSPIQNAEGEAKCCDHLHDSPELHVPIVIADEIVGCIRMVGGDDSNSGLSDEFCCKQRPFLALLADTVGRLCEQRSLLRVRVAELAALYRLTTEFSGQQDLQKVLDMVTSTVVDTLGAKACAIRLFTTDRSELIIKAAVNLSPQYLEKGPIMLSESKVDQEVLASLAPVYIADERTDPRVMFPAEAEREGIVSALCVPLVYQGRAEGIMRVYMSVLHEFNWFEISLVQAIAANASVAIVNARLYQEAVAGANAKRQLKLAGVVQRRMIPSTAPMSEGFDIAAVYVPCFDLGGDFYDFIELPQDNLGLAVCDVVGKGVRASLLMASVRASLRAHASNLYSMTEILKRVNHSLCHDSYSSDFATLFYAVLDLRARRFTYSNAGHTPPLLFRDKEVRELTVGGPVLGVEEYFEWDTESIECHSGDVVLIYTDGLHEAMNFEDEEFGEERIKSAVRAAIDANQDANGIVQHVLWEMRRFAGLHTRFDDLTMMAVRVL